MFLSAFAQGVAVVVEVALSMMIVACTGEKRPKDPKKNEESHA